MWDSLAAAYANQVVGGQGVERREQLVRAAYLRVAQAGFEGLRLRQVADDVGIDHSTLHHYMATKQQLIAAVAEYATGQLRSTMPDEPDAASALRGHLAALHQIFESRPELGPVTAELDLRARRDPAVRALMDAHEAGWRRGLRRLLTAGAEQGAWPGVDLDATVELLIATVKGARLDPTAAGDVFGRLVGLLSGTEHTARHDHRRVNHVAGELLTREPGERS